MSRPVVGVTGAKGRGWLLWVFSWFSLLLQGARGVRLSAPFEAERFEGLDALLIGGGDDIGATIYGGEAAPEIRIDPERDELELKALEMLWDRDIPIMGICRGSQMLNVFRGGRLHADIYETYEDAPRMRTPLPLKHVTVEPGTRLAGIIGYEAFRVNAIHHQSVSELGDGMQVAARDRYGIVQAVEYAGRRFRVGVQWHPEFLFYKRPHRRLFRAFVTAAKKRRAEREAAAPEGAVGQT